jgi:hypothetical protein
MKGGPSLREGILLQGEELLSGPGCSSHSHLTASPISAGVPTRPHWRPPTFVPGFNSMAHVGWQATHHTVIGHSQRMSPSAQALIR